MMGSVSRLALVLTLSVAYWVAVSGFADVAEPWDAPAYWPVAYPLSLLLAAGAGILLRRRGWLAGAIVTFSQLPVMLSMGAEPSGWPTALLFLTMLVVPAVAVSGVLGVLASRRRERRSAPR